MVQKYAALRAVEGLPEGDARDLALKAASRRWPGCLRESQLAGPDRCAERSAQALVGGRAPERTRAAWRGEGAAAVVLWADLHLLLEDLLLSRGHGVRGLAAFHRFVAGGAMAGRWPGELEALEAAGGRVVRPRLAYAWLAAQAGLQLPALNFLLFGRAGHWDAARPGDPAASG